jgi:hypothetical protein
MSTPVAGSLSVTPLYASAADVLVLWDDVNATWRSLPSVSAPMTVGQGGTGQTALTANAVLVGNGTGPITASAITSDNGATLRVSTNAVIGNAVTSPPSHALIINNAASTPQPAPANTFLMASNEAAQTNAVLDNYGTAGGPNLYLRKARGTAAAPTAVQAGDTIGNVQFFARGATGYSPGSAFVSGIAAENITDTAQGGQLSLGTITVGTTTQVNRVNVRSGVVIGYPATDPGMGGLTLNANAAAPQPTTVAPQAWIAGQDGAQALAVVDAYGSLPSLLLRRAQGTAAVPAAVASGSNLGAINAAGFGVSTYATSAQFAFGTLETQSETARGTQITSATAAIGSTTVLTRTAVRQGLLVFDGSGTVPSGGTNGDMGAGTVNVASGYYVNGGGAAGVALVASGNSYINSGNVGIGTTAPGEKLSVFGRAAVGLAVTALRSGPNGADATTSLVGFQDFAQSVTIGGIVRSGTNQVSYLTSSDERLKSAITESERGLDALMAIKVSDYKMGKTASQGLLAQDVATVYPEAVHKGGKDPNLEPWMIDYGRLTPLLIKALQDLAAKVAALESGLGSRR